MKRAILLCLICIMMIIAGCGSGSQQPKNTGAMKELTFGVMPDVDSVPLVIAQEKGYFKEEGVKVNLKTFKSAMDRDAALQSGNLDGTISDMLAAAFAKSGGFDVKVTSISDGAYLLVTSDKTIKTIADLKGSETAVSRNTIIEYVTDRMLVQAKQAPDSIEKVVIPQIPVRLEMLQNGKLTAATLPEPMASVAIAGGCQLIASSHDLGIVPGIMLFTGRSAKEKTAEIKAFYRAYNKAVNYLNNANRDDYIPVLIDKAGFPKAAAAVLKLPEYNQAKIPAETDFSACIDWLKGKNLLKGEVGYDQLVTKDLLP